MKETKEEFMQAWHGYPFFVDGVPNIISTDELRKWEHRAAVHGLQVNVEHRYARLDQEEPCWVMLNLEPSSRPMRNRSYRFERMANGNSPALTAFELTPVVLGESVVPVVVVK